jgi:hypothetical protein
MFGLEKFFVKKPEAKPEAPQKPEAKEKAPTEADMLEALERSLADLSPEEVGLFRFCYNEANHFLAAQQK